MTPTISTTALGRRYRGQVALDNVSLAVEPGTVTGPATAVEEFVAGRPVWHRQRLGARASPPSAGSPSDGRPGAGLRTAAGRYALQ
jgi:hypothetical protein